MIMSAQSRDDDKYSRFRKVSFDNGVYPERICEERER
jgi:hypothetical protein